MGKSVLKSLFNVNNSSSPTAKFASNVKAVGKMLGGAKDKYALPKIDKMRDMAKSYVQPYKENAERFQAIYRGEDRLRHAKEMAADLAWKIPGIVAGDAAEGAILAGSLGLGLPEAMVGGALVQAGVDAGATKVREKMFGAPTGAK